MTTGNVIESFFVLKETFFFGTFSSNVSAEKSKVCTGRVCTTNL